VVSTFSAYFWNGNQVLRKMWEKLVLSRRRRALALREVQESVLGSPTQGETPTVPQQCVIGGKARNMHLSVKARRITGTGMVDKTAVMGILERGGEVRTTVVADRKKKTLQAEVKRHVEAGAALYTDALRSYDGLASKYAHQVIDHAVQYVDGKVHTNGLENFWSLLKRSINGTYVSLVPYHLFRYLDEQSFRYNNRKLTDAERFDLAVKGMVGKRLTYEGLTGKVAATQY